MDFSGLLLGLATAIQPENLLAALLGVFAGNLVGVLPGLGPIGAAAVLFPLTLQLNPAAGIIMIAGIYFGSQFGGSTTAILLKIPGEPGSLAAMYDGYQMTLRGRGAAALGVATIGSFFAGTLAVVGVTVLTPVLSQVALAFGQAELLALTAGGLLVVSTIMGRGGLRSIVPMFLGLLLATIGQDAVSGTGRFTFGVRDLYGGIPPEVLAIGMFGVGELLVMAGAVTLVTRVGKVRVRDVFPNKEEWRRALPAWMRGSAVGFGVGLLPGPAATISAFLAYRAEKTFSRHRAELGKGAVEGVAAPEAANNAAATAGVVPILGLGIPFSVTLAFMLSAMISQGITPGPLLMQKNPEIYWGLIASMYIANILLVILNIPLIGLWVRMLRVPSRALIPGILVISTYAAFVGGSKTFTNLWLVVAFAAIATLLAFAGFDLAPMLLGLILGPMIEKYLRQALVVGQNDPAYLVHSPIAVAIWIVVLVVLVVPPSLRLVKRRAARATGRKPHEPGVITQALDTAVAAAWSGQGGNPRNRVTDTEHARIGQFEPMEATASPSSNSENGRERGNADR